MLREYVPSTCILSDVTTVVSHHVTESSRSVAGRARAVYELLRQIREPHEVTVASVGQFRELTRLCWSGG